MTVEIERKFLVYGAPWQELGIQGVKYIQGYLSTDPTRVVRVRVCQKPHKEEAFITIKSSLTTLSASEYEYAIPTAEAHSMLQTVAHPTLIEKIRYHIPHEGNIWHVDSFLGDNAGLVTAEIELAQETQSFVKPAWIGDEISHEMRYKNVQLVQNPFSHW